MAPATASWLSLSAANAARSSRFPLRIEMRQRCSISRRIKSCPIRSRSRSRACAKLAAPRVREQEDTLMHSERRGGPHLHAAFSLLRLALGARLLFVGAASALLWSAVFWALR